MSHLRIAIMMTGHPDRQLANEAGEVEIRTDQLTDNGRLVLRNLLDQLRIEMDESDYRERIEADYQEDDNGNLWRVDANGLRVRV